MNKNGLEYVYFRLISSLHYDLEENMISNK